MTECLLSLRDVAFRYEPDRPVLDGVDLEVRRGERLGLLGPNGCGKTTILHLMVGLVRPLRGEVFAFGAARRTEQDFLEVRRRAGLLFQDPDDQLFCPTVAEDVAFGPLNLGRTRQEVREIVAGTLGSLGLGGYEDRITYRLSGGEKRLVSLATVLAMEPDVLLLDEPTAGLDESSHARLIALLASLPQSLVVVSHDHDLLRRVATRAVALEAGRIRPYDLT